ncbi:MAG: YqaJ-like viral recombinase domain protein [Parcubacteria group bacterium ADurb.Bin216]|nr:MAG: YqaJ-like viral recombinase domain protein [Parcubacteria group bacterium ADurb.Bin216]
MQVNNCEQRTPEWHEARQGRITGTGLKKIVGTKAVKDNYFYEALAERLSLQSVKEQSDLDRGVEMEDVALAEFEAKTGKIVQQVGFCTRDDNQFIGNSPDGLIENNGKYTEALEIKCPSSAKHLRYIEENKIPEEYYAQCIQYFIVNDDLQTLYFMSYDDRIPGWEVFIKEMHRDEILEDIEYYKERQEEFIKEIDEAVSRYISF